MVFKNLVGYKEDTSSTTTAHPILACRLVNKYWKCVADKLLEPATISALEIELRGKSNSEIICVETIQSLFPTLYTASKPQQRDFALLKKIWCPSFLKEMDTNPFPSKSLQISGVNRDQLFSTSHFSQMSVLKLMSGWDLGLNLTSFMLCEFRISPYILKLLLERMPNLKVLGIWNGLVVLDEGDEHLQKNQFKLPPLDQLKMLKCRNNHVLNPPEKFCQPGVNTWVVNLYVGSQTLTHLEVQDDDNKLCLSLKNFPSLKSLKLWHLKDKILSTSESLPLEQLSINFAAGCTVPFKVFTDFLKKFSSTLVHLEIFAVSVNKLKPSRFNFGKKVICNFPNLNFFSWSYPENQEAMQVLALHFLPMFPALEKLELTQFWVSKEVNSGEDSDDDDDAPLPQKVINEIATFLERENYWGICTKLQSIYVYGSRPEREIYVGYRNQKT